MESQCLRALVPLLCLVVLCQCQLIWEEVSTGNRRPVPRRDAGLGYEPNHNVLILFGGRTEINKNTLIRGDTWIFDLATGTWRQVTAIKKPSARFGFVSGVSQNYFYVSTGEGPNQMHLNDIWRFDVSSETWEELPVQSKPSFYSDSQWQLHEDDMLHPRGRYGSSGGIYHNASSLYVSHGLGDERYSDTFTYNVMSNGWFKEYDNRPPYNPSYPHARCLAAGTMMSADEMLIYGGCLSGGKTGGPCPAGDSWIFDGKTKDWKKLDTCASPRTDAALAMLPTKDGQRRAVLYGGQEDSDQVLRTVESPADQVGVFNPDTKEWALRAAKGKIPSKRMSVSFATGKDGIYMFGGAEVDDGALMDDLHILLGDAMSADQAPLQADCNPSYFSLLILHGILMTAGWGFFIQWGAFIAAYCQHRSKWFPMHILFQIFGLFLSIGGLVCGIMSVRGEHFQFVHAIAGLVTMVLGVLQPINALLRPKHPDPGEPKTVRRAVWEVWHGLCGKGAVLLGLANICLGVFLAVSSLIIWVAWYSYLGVVLLIHLLASINARWRTRLGGELYVSNNRYGFQNKRGHLIINDKHQNVYDNPALESEG